MNTKHQILIIGGGTGGIMVAAQLKRKNSDLNIAIIEPSDTHYYQPAWTLVGAGTFDYKKTGRPMASLIPSGVRWIKDKVVTINPDKMLVTTEKRLDIGYDYLVIAPGLVMAPSMIDGLEEALEKGIACSIYTDPETTWEKLREFKGGNALFTQPSTPIKCGGAPQKIAYLASHYLKKKGLLKKTKVIFATPGTVIFGVAEIRNTLEKVIKRYGIKFKPYHAPIRIDVAKKEAIFKYTAKEGSANPDDSIGMHLTEDGHVAIPFDFLHLAPPQAPPTFVRNSVLANDDGWLAVDHHSMQHKQYPNIFGLGDVAALPTAKTGAAIRKQAPVVVDNLLKLIANKEADNISYNGYSSCPLVTGYGKMVLAEFDYSNNFTPDPKLKQMLIFNSAKEHWRLWILKKYGLPFLYWNKMMKGKEV